MRFGASRAAVILSFTDAADMRAGDWVRLNGALCPALGSVESADPKPCDYPYAFEIPRESIHDGYNLIEAQTESRRKITWAEISFMNGG